MDGWKEKQEPATAEMKKDAASEALADPRPEEASTAADEKSLHDRESAEPGSTTTDTTTPPSSGLSQPTTNLVLPPLAPPPASPPATRQEDTVADYYSSRPGVDRLGNPIPDQRRPSAMASVYGKAPIKLPGDLGAKDPRRPKSPAPSTLPGDLGAKDPRRPKSTNSRPAPPHVFERQTSLEGSEGGASVGEQERILKDPKQPSPEEERRHESDENVDEDNDNDTDVDADGEQRGRGRKRPEPGRTTSGKSVNLRDESVDFDADSGGGAAKPDPTKGQSKFNFKPPSTTSSAPDSLKIHVTAPGKSGKRRVHPSTAFDIPASGTSTPIGGSVDESHSELRAAQKLTLTMSGIHSTPSAHRVIRQIIRGDYAYFQREAEEGRKRQRMYLVATDMSPESEYALEWTIGTVLRDGDTLFAVYAADEESVAEGGGSREGGVEIGHGAESVRDTAQIVQDLPPTNVPPPSPLVRNDWNGSSTNVASGRSRSRGVYSSAEQERMKATETISERCIHLLRKTRLQVRVVVEVFHCKSPRHMLTEIIDYLSPTLVIIGSRGRSNVKGVLLGSFSNYLVTKSSQPVMVARKKLRKHSMSAVQRNKDGTLVPYTGSGRSGRFSNVIQAPSQRGLRVSGWDEVGID